MSASEDLANIVKGLHSELRRSCLDLGGDPSALESVWSQHVRQEHKLRHYSQAMNSLANDHWTKGPEENSRIVWITKQIRKFYLDKDRDRILRRLAKKAGLEHVDQKPPDLILPLRTLDVGSCFNPFSEFPDILDVLAIDLAPASPTVRKCDFLSVQITESSDQELSLQNAAKEPSLPGEDQDCTQASEETEVTSLPRSGFDAVIFCLLLEYLPVPLLRHRACVKARDALKPGGLLLIVTPDSSHQGRNLSVIRSWGIALALLGLTRIYYEKLDHVHGMAFMKVEDNPEYAEVLRQEAEREARKMGLDLASCDPERDLMIIPQDRSTKELVDRERERETRASCQGELDEGEVLDMLSMLPPDL